jgi:hypothetical protein
VKKWVSYDPIYIVLKKIKQIYEVKSDFWGEGRGRTGEGTLRRLLRN